MYFYDYSWLIFVIPAMLFAMFASSRVNSAYRKYSQERSMLGMTGQEVANRILRNNGINDIAVVRTDGILTDHYDSRKSIIALSDEVYSGTSIASIAIAAHEAGHAVQLEQGYVPLKLRHALVGITQIASSASYIFILLGFYMDAFFGKIGVLLFGIIFIFQVVTLPVEFNASARAVDELAMVGAPTTDLNSASKMLKAAALTYVAAMLSALGQLLRFISIFGKRRD